MARLPDIRPKVKRGQIWKKKAVAKIHSQKDQYVLIINRGKDDYWRTVNLDNRKNSHHIRVKDLWLFYELVGAASTRQSENVRADHV